MERWGREVQGDATAAACLPASDPHPSTNPASWPTTSAILPTYQAARRGGEAVEGNV